MMNRRVDEISAQRVDNANTARVLISTSLLLSAVFVLCGCAQQNDGSVFKVQSGEKTLLDIKKNPDEKVSIEVDVPKVNLKMRNSDETYERTTVTETTVNPPVTPSPSTAPQPVPGVPIN